MKKRKMTFRQFRKWMNARWFDGYWSAPVAILCVQIAEDVIKKPWWHREKYFHTNYDVDELYKVICEINDNINFNKKTPKGEFE